MECNSHELIIYILSIITAISEIIPFIKSSNCGSISHGIYRVLTTKKNSISTNNSLEMMPESP